MRKRIWLFCGIILLICALFVLLKQGELQNIVPGENIVATTNSPARQAEHESLKLRPSTNTPRLSEILKAEMIRRGTQESSNEIRQKILADWQRPIEFYGKVVDESGNPIAGVDIKFHWSSLLEDDTVTSSTTASDSEGLFALHGRQGASLTVWVSKKGYFSSQRGQKGFSYALADMIHSPDPGSPVIFLLRKKGQGTELITSENGVRPNLVLRVPTNGVPVQVDLFQKEIRSSGQLEISQNKPPWREAIEWSFKIAVPGGGLVENQDEFQFEAPEVGYQPTTELHFRKGETNWLTHFSKNYYISFGEPRRYGWVHVETDISQQSVFLKYAINPTGSRNLEPLETQSPHPELPAGTTDGNQKFE